MTREVMERYAVAALLGVCLLARGAFADCPYGPEETAELVSFCGATSWTSGVSELCDGHLVYRDYVYDAYGADKPIPTIRWNPNSSNAGVVPTGDDRYAEGEENTADLVRFDMSLEDGRLDVEFELNTLYSADQTIAAIAIDTDDDPTTGGGPWPGLDTASNGWDEIHVFDEGDPETNVIRGSFPAPAGDHWKIWVATAQSDGTVMNVGFRGTDETAAGAWFDTGQATALANGDITEFSYGLCRSDLAGGATRGAPRVTGYHERVYTSAYTLPPGEGVSIDGIPGPRVMKSATDPRVYQAFNFLGRYQPYAFYLPDEPGPHGLQLTLHGFSGTHNSGAAGDASAQQAFGDALNRILVSPLGRGLAGAYSDISERDVLDVLDDAKAFFHVDESRVLVSGISMGGYGQLHLGVLYPHLFAGMVGWVSPTGNFEGYPFGQTPTYIPESLPANTAKMVRNLRHVPSVLLYGVLDEFVLAIEAEAMRQALLAENPGEFDFYLNLDTDHVSTYGFDQTKEAAISADWRIPERVARVTYRFDPSLETRAYALSHDRAYWVSGIRERGSGYAGVDLHSRGCGLAEPVTEDGGEFGAGPLPFVWQHTFRHRVGETPVAAANVLEGVLANVASLRIDVAAACLEEAELRYVIETDGPVELEFSDGRLLSLSAAGRFEGML